MSDKSNNWVSYWFVSLVNFSLGFDPFCAFSLDLSDDFGLNASNCSWTMNCRDISRFWRMLLFSRVDLLLLLKSVRREADEVNQF